MNDEGNKYEYEITFSKGDEITFTKNDYVLYDVRNGERGTVLETKPDTLRIELEDKRIIKVNLKEYSSFDYGYALSTYKSQGQTFDKVVIESDTRFRSLSDMRHQYVNITRAKHDVHIYTDNKEDLKELALIRSVKHDTLDDNYSIEKLETMQREVSYKISKDSLELLRSKLKAKEITHKKEHTLDFTQ